MNNSEEPTLRKTLSAGSSVLDSSLEEDRLVIDLGISEKIGDPGDKSKVKPRKEMPWKPPKKKPDSNFVRMRNGDGIATISHGGCSMSVSGLREKTSPYDFPTRIEDGPKQNHSDRRIKVSKTMTPPVQMNKKDIAVETDTKHVLTDPDCLGVCEPGTHVVLEGIVWNETETGVLVVNVTWKGKTYVGTLLDATKHDWAPPRLAVDSPIPEDRAKGRAKRKCAPVSTFDSNERKLRKGRKGSMSVASPAKPEVKGEIDVCDEEIATFADEEKQMEIDTPKLPVQKIKLDTPKRPFSCAFSGCMKRFRNRNGLEYHRSHAHRGLKTKLKLEKPRQTKKRVAVIKKSSPHDISNIDMPTPKEEKLVNVNHNTVTNASNQVLKTTSARTILPANSPLQTVMLPSNLSTPPLTSTTGHLKPLQSKPEATTDKQAIKSENNVSPVYSDISDDSPTSQGSTPQKERKDFPFENPLHKLAEIATSASVMDNRITASPRNVFLQRSYPPTSLPLKTEPTRNSSPAAKPDSKSASPMGFSTYLPYFPGPGVTPFLSENDPPVKPVQKVRPEVHHKIRELEGSPVTEKKSESPPTSKDGPQHHVHTHHHTHVISAPPYPLLPADSFAVSAILGQQPSIPPYVPPHSSE